MQPKNLSIPNRVMQRIKQGGTLVWTINDFTDLGSHEAVKKALQRKVASHTLRRIDRGLYDQPRINALTGNLTVPDYRMVIDAISRRDQARTLIDGLTAANDLGLTNAVPAKIIVHTDIRATPIQLGNLIIQFKLTAPSKLYWAGHPAMRIVQSLYWLRDGLKKGILTDEFVIKNKLIQLLKDPKQGLIMQNDLASGLNTLPSWMQHWIRNLFLQIDSKRQQHE